MTINFNELNALLNFDAYEQNLTSNHPVGSFIFKVTDLELTPAKNNPDLNNLRISFVSDPEGMTHSKFYAIQHESLQAKNMALAQLAELSFVCGIAAPNTKIDFSRLLGSRFRSDIVANTKDNAYVDMKNIRSLDGLTALEIKGYGLTPNAGQSALAAASGTAGYAPPPAAGYAPPPAAGFTPPPAAGYAPPPAAGYAPPPAAGFTPPPAAGFTPPPAAGYAPPPAAGYAPPPAAGYAPPPAAGYAPPPAAGYAPPPAAGFTPPPAAGFTPTPAAGYAPPPAAGFTPPPPADQTVALPAGSVERATLLHQHAQHENPVPQPTAWQGI